MIQRKDSKLNSKRTARARTPTPVAKTSPFTVTIPLAIAFAIDHDIREDIDLSPYTQTHKGQQVVVVDLDKLPLSFANQLRRRMPDTPVALLAAKLLDRPTDDVLDTLVSTVAEFGRMAGCLANQDTPVIEMQLNSIWYPVPFTCDYSVSPFGEFVTLRIIVRTVDFTTVDRWEIDRDTFTDPGGNATRRTVREILLGLGLRITTPERITEFRKALAACEARLKQNGHVADVTTSLLLAVEVGWRKMLLSSRFGTDDAPKIGILESELEVETDFRDGGRVYQLPVLRVFSPDLKRYGYVDVRSITDHAFDTTAKDRIVLEAKSRRIFDAIFAADPNTVFGDLFRNRHGGIVILAAGDTGTGKTLTAEVYSEFTKRPLYCMEMGELGTSLDSVEQNLQLLFDRARRWRAVLLFDEADIFLSKRGDDLEKAAIVGVFLRLLDQYEGTFFLTTNRPDVMDDAFRSRITVRVDYPKHTSESRMKVWSLLFQAAGFSAAPDVLVWLTQQELNGRNARNATRILRILNPDTQQLTQPQIEEALNYIAR